MKLVGAHVSVEQGVSHAPLNARRIGARSFALFTRNPSRWTSKAISEAEAEKFKANCAECGYDSSVILPHDSFLINLGSPDKEKLEKSRTAFLDEMHRCEQLGLTMLNFHPGSHMRELDPDRCLDLIAESINIILDQTSGVKAVIENTAGQGSNLGYTFEQIAHIIDKVDDKSRVGVCIDTCHAHSAGYDMTTPEAYADTWRQFEQVIGLKYFSAMHLNDTLKAIGSHVDRHAPIGTGLLGETFWTMLMNDPRMEGIPLILETPDESLWPEEIARLISLEKN
ncbi:MAG: deoxyribonuclease IV [Muribaculaceae bacterium]|nr:deoxyribonuclease IV [Muribaculaceae bacterium]